MTALPPSEDLLRSLVTDVICLLLDELQYVKYSPASTPRRPAVHKARGDRWAKLDSLLFPYMIYNLKAFSVASRHTASSSSAFYDSSYRMGQGQTKTLNKIGMLKAFAKSNIGSEPAVNHASDLLADVANALLDPLKSETDREKVKQQWTLKYRRLGERRMQAAVSTLNGLDFVWETCDAAFAQQHAPSRTRSSSVSTLSPSIHNNVYYPSLDSKAASDTSGRAPQVWKLRKFTFSDSDDEEHYWRPWELTLSDAEADYVRFQQQDFKTELVSLDVRDLDWDSMTSGNLSSNSHSRSDDQETVTTTHSWSIFESSSKAPSTKATTRSQANSTRGTTSNAIAGRRKKPGKPLGGGAQALPTYESPPMTINHSSAFTPLSSALAPQKASTAGRPLDTHIYNHHNDFANPDPDFTEDYAYNQAHPVFKHDFEDDDDLFGVCHGMAEETKPAAPVVSVASQRHLQTIIGGDHDTEAAYWDLYDDEVEY